MGVEHRTRRSEGRRGLRSVGMCRRAHAPACRAVVSLAAGGMELRLLRAGGLAPVVRSGTRARCLYFQMGMLVDRDVFLGENASARAEGRAVAEGKRSNPIYFPAPHEVARALYMAFRTPPRLPSEPWLPSRVSGTTCRSSAVGSSFRRSSVCRSGILCGSFPFFSRLNEPFLEFFRYLPAPAFGAARRCGARHLRSTRITRSSSSGPSFSRSSSSRTRRARWTRRSWRLRRRWVPDAKAALLKVILPSIVVDLYTDMRIFAGLGVDVSPWWPSSWGRPRGSRISSISRRATGTTRTYTPRSASSASSVSSRTWCSHVSGSRSFRGGRGGAASR